jgi:glycosyltransferase involved in cell wall biosynthesis
MNIIQLTPGAGAMYCGNCFRDNALVAVLRKMGHEVTMVPLYLPLTLDEPDQSSDTPIFFSGINVYLQQKSELFRQAPGWMRNLLASRSMLRWASGRAAKTRPSELGELTLSMLRGEEGRQARELDDLIEWIKNSQSRPDLICLSNALLLGMARRLRSALGAPVVCCLQGEDSFLDSLPESHRAACWQMVTERAAEVEAFIAPSRYFADLMSERLSLASARVHVVHNGIDLSGYPDPRGSSKSQKRSDELSPPVLGYFARMCKEKGLDRLVETFILLRKGGRLNELKLRIGGSCGPADEPFVNKLRQQLNLNGLSNSVEFCPNLARTAKIAFLQSLSVFSVPAVYGEAFGLYVIEAMAAGVPVIQPRTAAFPELLEATGGGVLCAPNNPQALADAIESLLLDSERAIALGRSGARAVWERFSADSMAQASLSVYEQVCAFSHSQQTSNQLPT